MFNKDGGEIRPGFSYFVGGNTKVYGAALFRLREKDFESFRHRDGISPEWPIKYRDWENYYTQAEELYEVHGKAGEDPTEPWRSKEYPHPPISHEPRIKEVFEILKTRGIVDYTENNSEPFDRLTERWKGILKEIGCGCHIVPQMNYFTPKSGYFTTKMPMRSLGHQVGTCKFGEDPKTSTLDLNCRAHDVNNLYVVDGSFFVSSGAVNPTLTIIANALRVGDHLLERLGAQDTVVKEMNGTLKQPIAPEMAAVV